MPFYALQHLIGFSFEEKFFSHGAKIKTKATWETYTYNLNTTVVLNLPNVSTV